MDLWASERGRARLAAAVSRRSLPLPLDPPGDHLCRRAHLLRGAAERVSPPHPSSTASFHNGIVSLTPLTPHRYRDRMTAAGTAEFIRRRLADLVE
jgi:hypothetical protein